MPLMLLQMTEYQISLNSEEEEKEDNDDDALRARRLFDRERRARRRKTTKWDQVKDSLGFGGGGG